MNIFKIGSTEIILRNESDGVGKIIISDLERGSYSHFWGAMGNSIEKFLCEINEGYFASKLCNQQFSFSGKATAKYIRKYIREELSYDLPWYEYMTFQKQFRAKIKELEEMQSEEQAFYFISGLHEQDYDFDSFAEEREVRAVLKNSFSNDTHYFLQTDYSREYKFLEKLHKGIKSYLETQFASETINTQ